ncbi:MAG: 16S rRNA (guanine(527)-N(7))-methyltransferase RsmG [Actinomycetota bacterium]
MFGASIDRARAFTHDLARRGEELGLIGPLELPRLWTRHILNCALLAPLVLPGRVGDVGSGAGLPGLVLAIARPDVQFVLIEPMERRVDWLRSEAKDLALDNVEVVRARAEDLHSDWRSTAPSAPVSGDRDAIPNAPARGLDQVTARAVSALSKLIPITAPLVRTGGQLLFLKGASVDSEIQSAAKAIRKARLSTVEVLELGEGKLPEITRVFRATVD